MSRSSPSGAVQATATVAHMARSLDFYLGLGCDVCRATDGWAELRCGPTAFVLVAASGPGPVGDPPPRGQPWVRLTTPDLRALRWRLLGAGVATGALRHPVDGPAGRIVVVDPDGRTVRIDQTEQTGAAAPRHPSPHPRARTSGERWCTTGSAAARAGTSQDVAPDPR